LKKINPQTGSFYKRGDFNETRSHRFWSYKTGHLNRDGYFSISWKKTENYENDQRKQSLKQKKVNSKNKQDKLPRRLNPLTGQYFKLGEVRDDGYVFCGYTSNGRVKGGFRGESWLSPESYLKYRIGLTVEKAKRRASEANLAFNLTSTEMLAILPDGMLCPILGIKMEFGGDRDNSPSLDRLVPEKGYILGNVKWVSKLANSVKSDKTPEELRTIADWIEKQPIWIEHHLTPYDTNDRNDN